MTACTVGRWALFLWMAPLAYAGGLAVAWALTAAVVACWRARARGRAGFISKREARRLRARWEQSK